MPENTNTNTISPFPLNIAQAFCKLCKAMAATSPELQHDADLIIKYFTTDVVAQPNPVTPPVRPAREINRDKVRLVNGVDAQGRNHITGEGFQDPWALTIHNKETGEILRVIATYVSTPTAQIWEGLPAAQAAWEAMPADRVVKEYCRLHGFELVPERFVARLHNPMNLKKKGLTEALHSA